MSISPIGLSFNTGIVINVKDAPYNAKGDGITDDTAAIQAAVSAATSRCVVFFPSGTYNVSLSINLPSNIKLCGVGSCSKLKATASGIVIFNAITQSTIVVEDLLFDGNTVGGMGIQFNTVTNFIVRRCWFQNFNTTVPVLGYCGGVFGYLCDDSTVQDCIFTGNGFYSASVFVLTSDIQINGNGTALDCTKRVNILNNKCLSILVDTNIAIYDCAYSNAIGNICTGAVLASSGVAGYGIMFYKTALANPGTARRNRIIGNLVYSVKGNGIYVQAQNDTVVADNVLEDCGATMDDNSLACGGIGISSSPKTSVTGNTIFNCHKSGITLAGALGFNYGHTVSGNTIDGVDTSGAVSSFGTGILLRGPVQKSVISNNTVLNTARGIGTIVSDQGLVECIITGNVVDTTTSEVGYDFYGLNYSVISNNIAKNTYRDGFSIGVNSNHNTFSSNQAWDGSVFGDNVYSAFTISGALDTTLIGNEGGNTGGTGFKHVFFVNSTSVRSVVVGNKATGARTSNYNVDQTIGNKILYYGNFDNSAATPSVLTMGTATLLQTNIALTNGAAAAAGTLANAPAAGNPTKWIPINDNGTVRYIPAW